MSSGAPCTNTFLILILICRPAPSQTSSMEENAISYVLCCVPQRGMGGGEAGQHNRYMYTAAHTVPITWEKDRKQTSAEKCVVLLPTTIHHYNHTPLQPFTLHCCIILPFMYFRVIAFQNQIMTWPWLSVKAMMDRRIRTWSVVPSACSECSAHNNPQLSCTTSSHVVVLALSRKIKYL